MTNRYLNPTVDIVFKKLFGEKGHKDLTIDFLNNVLERKKGELITKIDFNDTFNRKDNKDDRLSVVDVRCTDQAGETYIVEMQAEFEVDFAQRCQYYVACELSSQLSVKKPYASVTPVIMVAVLDFNLFEQHDRYLTHHVITDTNDHKSYLKHMQFHFVELKKFKKTESELKTALDRWLFFFRSAEEYRAKPARVAKNSEVIATAFEIVDQTNWKKKDLIMYERRVDLMRRRRATLVDAREKSFNKGMTKGEQKGHEAGLAAGREEGRAAGREEGREDASLAIARNMLAKGIDIDTIIDVTGLSRDAIRKLRKK